MTISPGGTKQNNYSLQGDSSTTVQTRKTEDQELQPRY